MLPVFQSSSFMHSSTGIRRSARPTHARCWLGATRFDGALCDACLRARVREPPSPHVHVGATASSAAPAPCYAYRCCSPDSPGCCCSCSRCCYRRCPYWTSCPPAAHWCAPCSKRAQPQARPACKTANPCWWKGRGSACARVWPTKARAGVPMSRAGAVRRVSACVRLLRWVFADLQAGAGDRGQQQRAALTRPDLCAVRGSISALPCRAGTAAAQI